jgi:hypothetical protein
MSLSYAGYDALDIEPNRVTQRGMTIARAVDGYTSPTGNVVTATTDAAAVSSFTTEWICATRADLIALTDFLDARKGQIIPCWIPTFQRDLYVESIGSFGKWVCRPGAAVDTLALIPTVPAWQHWSIAGPPLGARGYGHLSVVDDQGGGVYWVRHGTDFILPAGAVTGPYASPQGVIFSRAMLCRLTTGAFRVQYVAGPSIVTAEWTEVPAEAPTF